MPLSLPVPSIFAHRGASKVAPENTLAAFHRAYESGCEGTELDVRLSADAQVVVCHDTSVRRTTDGRGRIERMTLAELQALDAGSWFSPQYGGERIPTLAQVLEQFGEKTVLNIELKPSGDNSAVLASLVAELVTRYGLQQRVIISSFSRHALGQCRQFMPEGNFSLLAATGMFGWWARQVSYKPQRFYALHPDYRDVTPAKIKARPRQIAYTVNQPQDMRRLFTWGILGIITDDPEIAVKIRAEVLA